MRCGASDTIEAAGREVVTGTLSSTVTVSVVPADEPTARQLARAVLPGGANLIAVTNG